MRKVRPVYDRPDFHRWIVGESPAGAAVLDLDSDDLLFVGGVPDVLRSPDLESSSPMVGVVYTVEVDDRDVGVWNFVKSSRGCGETHPGALSDAAVDEHGCYTFVGGDGYATQTNIRNYDPRYLSVSLEFRSFDENALILLIMSDNQVRSYYCKSSMRYRPLLVENTDSNALERNFPQLMVLGFARTNVLARAFFRSSASSAPLSMSANLQSPCPKCDE